MDLDAIRHGVAQEVVDGTTGIEDAAARVAQRHAEVAAAEEAIAIVRQRRVKAIQERYKAEAGEMRAIAARCRQEAVDILKRCEPLLRKLSDLQGLTYSFSILLAQRNSQWTGSYITGAPIEECNPMEATADFNAGFLAPRSRELLGQVHRVLATPCQAQGQSEPKPYRQQALSVIRAFRTHLRDRQQPFSAFEHP